MLTASVSRLDKEDKSEEKLRWSEDRHTEGTTSYQIYENIKSSQQKLEEKLN